MKFNLKKLIREKRSESHIWGASAPNYMNPIRDWAIGLGVSVLLLVAGTLFTAYDFYEQFGAPAREVTAEVQPVTYNEKEVVEYARVYSERERIFNALRAERVSAVEVPEITIVDTAETQPLAEE